jgi:hypothetical protein
VRLKLMLTVRHNTADGCRQDLLWSNHGPPDGHLLIGGAVNSEGHGAITACVYVPAIDISSVDELGLSCGALPNASCRPLQYHDMIELPTAVQATKHYSMFLSSTLLQLWHCRCTMLAVSR